MDWRGARGESWRAHLDGLEALLAPVNGPLVEALRLDEPVAVADIGCGGGGAARAVAAAAPAGSTVHGFDVSEALVDAARAAGVEVFLRDVEFAAAPRGYDRLCSRFGVMFFVDSSRAFENLAGWLRPGGRFAFTVWGPEADNPWAQIVRGVTAERVELPAVDPDGPGPLRFQDASALTRRLEAAGFDAVRADTWRGRLPMGPTPEAAADFALGAFSSFAAALRTAGEGVVDDARQALTARLAEHVHDGAVRLGARVHLVTGERPSR